jgi:hypothetical protein
LIEPGNVRTDFTASRRDVLPPPGPAATAAETGDGDPYAAMVAKAVGLMERDEADGVAGRTMWQPPCAAILRSPTPAAASRWARRESGSGIIAKRLMPYRLFERAAKSSLGV